MKKAEFDLGIDLLNNEEEEPKNSQLKGSQAINAS